LETYHPTAITQGESARPHFKNPAKHPVTTQKRLVFSALSETSGLVTTIRS
jgi:hypothetical protein